ncbi:hypothetical protein MAR_034567 [Mya arenaria]|uniref:Uncharacterized protein n=1 Tax=Mya arenaria TaxID=6604 RepID=A0ABY7EQN7_MYAAR|nr:hypothetical protein MAR_034567 [Mya arenaria]
MLCYDIRNRKIGGWGWGWLPKCLVVNEVFLRSSEAYSSPQIPPLPHLTHKAKPPLEPPSQRMPPPPSPPPQPPPAQGVVQKLHMIRMPRKKTNRECTKKNLKKTDKRFKDKKINGGERVTLSVAHFLNITDPETPGPSGLNQKKTSDDEESPGKEVQEQSNLFFVDFNGTGVGGLDNTVKLWDVSKVIKGTDKDMDASIPRSFSV